MNNDTVTVRNAATGRAMTAEERAAFERDGYLVVPGVLDPDQVAHYASIVDGLYERQVQAGLLRAGDALHHLSAVHTCPELAPLVDHPRVLGFVWSILDWNVHVYHSHIDVHPPVYGERPFRFEWHQDGGRQNRELETDPRPRLSIKAAYWLSDVSHPGRGNFKLAPGSQTANRIDGPPRRDVPWPDPPGAIEVTANPGDVVLFDRRVWHARSDNHSTITRKGVFFGYTYRWVVSRDAIPTDGPEFTPVQRQLLGMLKDTDGDHAWGHEPASVPLYEMLREAGVLGSNLPALRDTQTGPVAQGRYLNAATATEPVAVLGAAAAQRLGIDRVFSGERIWIDNQWFYVAGILNRAEHAPEIDTSVLVGFPAAKTHLGFDGHPSTVYVRANTDPAVRSVLAILVTESLISSTQPAFSCPSWIPRLDSLATRSCTLGSNTMRPGYSIHSSPAVVNGPGSLASGSRLRRATHRDGRHRRRVSADRRVWTEWRWTGTRPNGSVLDDRGVIVYGIEDDRIVSARLYIEPFTG